MISWKMRRYENMEIWIVWVYYKIHTQLLEAFALCLWSDIAACWGRNIATYYGLVATKVLLAVSKFHDVTRLKLLGPHQNDRPQERMVPWFHGCQKIQQWLHCHWRHFCQNLNFWGLDPCPTLPAAAQEPHYMSDFYQHWVVNFYGGGIKHEKTCITTMKRFLVKVPLCRTAAANVQKTPPLSWASHSSPAQDVFGQSRSSLAAPGEKWSTWGFP